MNGKLKGYKGFALILYNKYRKRERYDALKRNSKRENVEVQ